MKLLTIVIPSYNSEGFLLDCLESLLIGQDEKLDVIVVNDGSKDKTSEIAHKFASEHSFVRVVDKENGGHGSGINVGIKDAKGLYFKVLDSDDHLDSEGLIHLLNKIEEHIKEDKLPDVYLADYRSCPQGVDAYQTMTLKHHFKKIEDIVTWDDVKRFKGHEFIMIHNVYVKTSILKDNPVHLLEKTLYEDNQYVYFVIKYSETLYYLEKHIYLYTVGRDGQSISLASIDKNQHHQLNVCRGMASDYHKEEVEKFSKAKQMHLRHVYLSVYALMYTFTYLLPTKEKKKAYKAFLKEYKTNYPDAYKAVRYHTESIIFWMWLPFLRHLVTKIGYKYLGKKEGWHNGA